MNDMKYNKVEFKRVVAHAFVCDLIKEVRERERGGGRTRQTENTK